MGFLQELDDAFVDHVYETKIKPATARADAAMKRNAPFRQGGLRDATGAGLAGRSNADLAVTILYSDPPQTAVYNSAKKNFGQVDYANFTNARGSSAGWKDRAVTEAMRAFDE